MKKDLSLIQKKIDNLRREIEKHRLLYHTYDSPIISDETYDSLMSELINLEKEYPEFYDNFSPSQKVGGIILDSFQKEKHKIPQWSYDNVFSFEELQNWEKRNQNFLKKEYDLDIEFNYVAELKIDGLKIVLEYKNGKLVKALTRGDGEFGENITHNVVTISSVPKYLKEEVDMIVIGECFLAKSDFKKINIERQKNGEELYKNPRNLAAGTLRQLDSNLVAERNLQFFAYDIENFTETNQWDELLFLKYSGFLVNKESVYCKNLFEVQNFYEIWNTEKKEKEEYGIDGIVVKVNQKNLEKKLKFTAKSPRAGIAYKLKSKEATAVVENITFQVGRSGVITPVAELSPTILDGTTVKRATLHNFDEIKRLDLEIGDHVLIRKAGDIIPQVFSVLSNLRIGNEKKIKEPKNCPICNSILEKDMDNNGVKLFCLNEECGAKKVYKIIYSVSKKCLNIDGFGEETVKLFYEKKLINSVSDIYKLDKKDILKLEGFKEKSVDNLFLAIENSKKQSLEKFITSLGIKTVGEETSFEIAKHFKNFNNFWEAKSSEFSSLYGFGEKTILEIISFKENLNNRKEVKELLKFIKIENHQEKETLQRLSNLRFVITGSFEKIKREDLERQIKNFGGIIQNEVNQKTSYLIKGEGGGSKFEKAKKLNIKIISLQEFNELL